MSKVYVPNLPVRRHPETREWVPAMNIEPARRRGEIVVLYSQDEVLAGPAPCEAVIEERMRDVRAEDFVLHIGDPAIMAIVVRAHARMLPGARLRLLKWDRHLADYLLVEVR